MGSVDPRPLGGERETVITGVATPSGSKTKEEEIGVLSPKERQFVRILELFFLRDLPAKIRKSRGKDHLGDHLYGTLKDEGWKPGGFARG